MIFIFREAPSYQIFVVVLEETTLELEGLCIFYGSNFVGSGNTHGPEALLTMFTSVYSCYKDSYQIFCLVFKSTQKGLYIDESKNICNEKTQKFLV